MFFSHLLLISVSSLFASFNPCINLFERGLSFDPLFIQKIVEGPEKTKRKIVEKNSHFRKEFNS